ncbi:hypothetical protein BGLT_02189 [Caballeronia glathei]|uniref:Uncharacterized protein n=1 Tax=Caballeronia glathei TaxID=60547 RepID=A0A069PG66_9BURK|nr:hypothetical protein [Caballeronia glathei]KDR39497.1 hypothetical protein BG61_31925 [Caballeronia glathei]CDY79408.1 hypothetical protein BGLT_02189 [Caballeronia glathei]
MSTSYVVFCQAYEEPVWGEQVIDWIHTGIVRVYRNRLRKAVFEWVGCPHVEFNLAEVRRTYPICKFADVGQDRPSVAHRAKIPFPDRRHA